jgi:hypothetical protein
MAEEVVENLTGALEEGYSREKLFSDGKSGEWQGHFTIHVDRLGENEYEISVGHAPSPLGVRGARWWVWFNGDEVRAMELTDEWMS